jgi:hypothetical protein
MDAFIHILVKDCDARTNLLHTFVKRFVNPFKDELFLSTSRAQQQSASPNSDQGFHYSPEPSSTSRQASILPTITPTEYSVFHHLQHHVTSQQQIAEPWIDLATEMKFLKDGMDSSKQKP